jgi:Rps23 Pro-64 3,4-dihydroxylase Tpa1-like proline 4-hydroxylase
MSTETTPRAFAQPAPHRVIRNFLGSDLIGQLLAHVDARQDMFKPTRISNSRLDPVVRVSSFMRDLGDLRAELEARFLAILDPMKAELRLSSIDLGGMEMEIVAHGDGAFYRRHIDTATGAADQKTDRALTSVFYFHAEPKKYSGGALRLYSILPPEAGGGYLDIMPEQDMLLLFPSWAPHEVLPVSCPSGAFMDQRFAINCWYRSRRKS